VRFVNEKHSIAVFFLNKSGRRAADYIKKEKSRLGNTMKYQQSPTMTTKATTTTKKASNPKHPPRLTTTTTTK